MRFVFCTCRSNHYLKWCNLRTYQRIPRFNHTCVQKCRKNSIRLQSKDLRNFQRWSPIFVNHLHKSNGSDMYTFQRDIWSEIQGKIVKWRERYNKQYSRSLSLYIQMSYHSKVWCVEWNTRGLFDSHGLTLIPTWKSYHLPGKVWDEITYPFLNFNGATVEV